MTRPKALLFDFDGVLLESEFAGNRQIADFLTQAGHPTSAADSMANFMGLSGDHFTQAIGTHHSMMPAHTAMVIVAIHLP